MMTVGQFVNKLRGPRSIQFLGERKPRSMNAFFSRYRMSKFWDAEVDSVELEVLRKEESGLWFDQVVCVITLKDKALEGEFMFDLIHEEDLK